MPAAGLAAGLGCPVRPGSREDALGRSHERICTGAVSFLDECDGGSERDEDNGSASNAVEAQEWASRGGDTVGDPTLGARRLRKSGREGESALQRREPLPEARPAPRHIR